MEDEILSKKLKYYKNLLKDTFPLTVTDMKNIVKSDLFNSLIRGNISQADFDFLTQELSLNY